MSSTDNHEHFIVPIKYYLITFIGLLLLTIITVYTAKFLNLGTFNIFLAMLIALIKGIMVLLFFMGLRWDKQKVNLSFFIYAIFVFVIFISLILFDISTRGNIDSAEDSMIDINTPVKVEK